MKLFPTGILALSLLLALGQNANAQIAGTTGANDLVLNAGTTGTVVVSATAGDWEKKAADDLAHYVAEMTGAKLTVTSTAPATNDPVFVIGQEALNEAPSLNQALQAVAKKNPVLRADAIVLRRDGNHVYLAGTNDDSHYYAVAELLRRWGCRWFVPTGFGECVPKYPALRIGTLDYSYGSPFEVRRYWISWNGSTNDRAEFMHRNFFNDEIVPSGHSLATYTADIVPPNKTIFNVPIAEPSTAEHVAQQIAPAFARGDRISLGMEDGIYQSDSPLDAELKGDRWDKYFMVACMTDPFMALYNNVANILTTQYPDSNAKIGFLAYSNITLPPTGNATAAKPLVAYLAPIDIDPIHGMDDPKSVPQHELKDIMLGWAHTMQGRVVIYDYDQGMLVWRDLPNPSINNIRTNIKQYRDAGILGMDTESRNAIGTIFVNLYLRGQLLWNPDTNVDALNSDLYHSFYGPAAKPMATYWNAINNAWGDTIATEHEYFVAPVIYTPALLAKLKSSLEAAEAIVQPLSTMPNPSADETLLLKRIQFARISFTILENYMAMVRAASAGVNYKAAVAFGEKALAARLVMANLDPTFTTHVINIEAETEANGPAWFPGEVAQYRDLQGYVDGTKGSLITRMPLEWAYRRDPNNTGLTAGWANGPVDLSYWKGLAGAGSIASHRNNPGNWEMLRTDMYVQAQGVMAPDGNGFTGYNWYRDDLPLKGTQTSGNVHIRFPGLLNEAWLYINGAEVAHREQNPVWWYNDYKFEWDVDLTGKLGAGANIIALRTYNPHHMGGMFRRPFLYRVK